MYTKYIIQCYLFSITNTKYYDNKIMLFVN